jgi:asparagine synthase (glutamine-hydrolysing)
MCGIAGIIGRLDEPNRAALRRMSQAMSHRGPDGEGLWSGQPDATGNGCMLAHRRLSILDLSTAASQPMTDPHGGGQTIVFNGEIYNYVALREELLASGEAFHSTGDTEVMLRLLATRGHNTVARLRGMFAFALWDESKRELTIARDPLGIKPLYLYRNPDPAGDRSFSLVFASEVRAILASGLVASPKLDPNAVASVVWNGFVAGPGTAVRGIESVWPGEVRVLDCMGREAIAKRFWSIPAGNEGSADADDLAAALQESVRLHLASDVPLGVFLSGGIDSSAVANLAQRAGDRPVSTFTLAFEESKYNEAPYARAVAEAIGSEHHEIVLGESDFLASLEPAFQSLDQPTFDGLNSYFISNAVRQAGLTVALVGTGGDELFGGYASFRYVPKLQRMANRTRWVPPVAKVAAAKWIAAAANRKGGAVAAQTRWAKLPEMVQSGNDLLRLYQLSYAMFLPEFQAELLNGVAGQSQTQDGLPPALRARIDQESAGRSAPAAVSVMEQRLFLGERLLRDIDAASMAVSLETRLPLVDQALVDVVTRLSDAQRFEPLGRKQALRNAGLAGLDPRLFDRPKSGFVMPFEAWIRQRLRGGIDEVLNDERLAGRAGLSGQAVGRLWQAFQDGAPGLYWSRVWSLYVLLRWCDRHGIWL